jgi:hypothetical protein
MKPHEALDKDGENVCLPIGRARSQKARKRYVEVIDTSLLFTCRSSPVPSRPERGQAFARLHDSLDRLSGYRTFCLPSRYSTDDVEVPLHYLR